MFQLTSTFLTLCNFFCCLYSLSFEHSISQVGPICESSPGSSDSERTGENRFVLLLYGIFSVCKKGVGGFTLYYHCSKYQLSEVVFFQDLTSNKHYRLVDSLKWGKLHNLALHATTETGPHMALVTPQWSFVQRQV